MGIRISHAQFDVRNKLAEEELPPLLITLESCKLSKTVSKISHVEMGDSELTERVVPVALKMHPLFARGYESSDYYR